MYLGHFGTANLLLIDHFLEGDFQLIGNLRVGSLLSHAHEHRVKQAGRKEPGEETPRK